MVEFRRHVTRTGVLVWVAFFWACAITPPPPQPHAGYQKRLIEWSAGHAMQQGMDKQKIPAGAEPSMRAPAETALEPGEKLWIRTGKSRVLRFRRPVRRVSVGDPEIAGIVVVGPRSVLINAKPLPRREGVQEGAETQALRLATVSNKTFTPEPYFGETTLTVWQDGSDQPEVHSLFIADFSTRQVVLEVTVA